MQRTETKKRVRALQLLYAWELQGKPPMQHVAGTMAEWNSRWVNGFEGGERIALIVAGAASRLDEEISDAADNWRWDRVGVIERNILRLALHELQEQEVPPRVTISEAVKLAHWFAGPKAPAFVNGVLDGIARDNGYL